MHQFYTYLEYSLEKYKANETKAIEDNWKQLTFENTNIEIIIDDFNIDDCIGHYEGL